MNKGPNHARDVIKISKLLWKLGTINMFTQKKGLGSVMNAKRASNQVVVWKATRVHGNIFSNVLNVITKQNINNSLTCILTKNIRGYNFYCENSTYEYKTTTQFETTFRIKARKYKISMQWMWYDICQYRKSSKTFTCKTWMMKGLNFLALNVDF